MIQKTAYMKLEVAEPNTSVLHVLHHGNVNLQYALCVNVLCHLHPFRWQPNL